jgi:hypothetical protein
MAIVNGKSGTFNISTKNSAISGYVKWQETYDNATYTTTNKSTITMTAYLHRTNIYDGATFLTNYPAQRIAYFGGENVTNNSNVTFSIPGNTSASGGAYIQVYSASKEITHDNDGSKSISIGFYMTVYNEHAAFEVPKTTSTATLTTIPRATTPTLSATSVTANGSNSITITIDPAASSFKHRLRYAFGSYTSAYLGFYKDGVQMTTTDYTAQGKTTITFKPDSSLCNQIPNANSGVCTIYLYTYTSSGTHIGTKSATLTLNVPSYTPAVSSPTLTGNNLLSGAYVQGKSTVTATITASSSYGATIKSISSVVDGRTYTGNSFTSSVLSSGSKTVSVTVTDTRGKTATATSSAFTVYAYALPNITEFTLARQSDGTTVIATVKGSVSAVNNKNAKTITVTLNGKTQTITSSAYTINGTTTFTGVPTDNTYTATAKIVDSYTSVSKSAALPTVAVTMDFHHSGKGIAMGKVAEKENLLDVAWQIKSGKPAETLTGLSYRGINPINSNEADTVENWSNQGNLATGFYNTDSPITKPTNYGFLTNITLGAGAKEAHQLWLEQAGGSIYHRGGNASGFKPWYKVLDNGNCPDYVIERGTTDGWEYIKWNSGKIELFGEKSLSFPAGTKQTDYLYRSIVSIDLSGLLTKIMSGTCCIQTNGMVPQVCRHSTSLAIAEIVIVTSRTFSAFTITAPIYIIGKWK